jgi:hypothetical protein
MLGFYPRTEMETGIHIYECRCVLACVLIRNKLPGGTGTMYKIPINKTQPNISVNAVYEF